MIFLACFLVFQKFFITFAEAKRKTMALLIRRHTHPLLAHWLRKGFRMGLLKIQGVLTTLIVHIVKNPLVRENRWGKKIARHKYEQFIVLFNPLALRENSEDLNKS